MISVTRIHHVAIIATDYEKSKAFYTEVLGCTLLAEVYREARQSWKADLAVNGVYQIELFSFPNPPARPSHPEAAGLRHLAFAVASIEQTIAELDAMHVAHEGIRTDASTGKRFTFIADPDGLPIECYEV